METFGETFEQFVRTDVDAKGRVFGFIVGLRDVVADNEFLKAGQCCAWVQRGIETDMGLGFKDFGVVQRSKPFPSREAAKAWAKATLAKRKEKYAA